MNRYKLLVVSAVAVHLHCWGLGILQFIHNYGICDDKDDDDDDDLLLLLLLIIIMTVILNGESLAANRCRRF